MWRYNNICFSNNIWKLWKYTDICLNKNNYICLITYTNCRKKTIYVWLVTWTYLCKKKWWIPDPTFFYRLGNKKCHLLGTRKRKFCFAFNTSSFQSLTCFLDNTYICKPSLSRYKHHVTFTNIYLPQRSFSSLKVFYPEASVFSVRCR